MNPRYWAIGSQVWDRVNATRYGCCDDGRTARVVADTLNALEDRTQASVVVSQVVPLWARRRVPEVRFVSPSIGY